jgi:hypothetical protein
LKYERIPTDDPIRQIWNRLDVLSTVTGARNFLVKKYQENNITPQQAVLDDKANGLAFCIRSANEYFKVPIEGNLTTACLAYYYGTFSLFKALLISNVNNTITLKDIEKYTIKGHGLTALTRDGGDYPEFEYIAILSNGFFAKYLQEYGYNISDIAVTKAYKKF